MFEYPALYLSACRQSQESQRIFFALIGAEYVLLFVAAILALRGGDEPAYTIACALVFLLSLGAFAFRSWRKPEQDWYRARALAESIKTSAWRFCMQAEPFGGDDSDDVTRREFCAHLQAILQINRDLTISPDEAAGVQITGSMMETRALDLQGRKEIYERYRIRDQRDWYVNKAKTNRKISRRWVWAGVAAYIIAICIVLATIAYPGQTIWPIEPLIVLSSGVIGWMQAKRFNELASSYTLAAHEIGIIHSRIGVPVSNKVFTEFVNEAEQAFSREHTQWVARQQRQ